MDPSLIDIGSFYVEKPKRKKRTFTRMTETALKSSLKKKDGEILSIECVRAVLFQ